MNTGSVLPSLKLRTDRQAHLGTPEWYVEIQARDSRDPGTGERGGEVRSTDYRLKMHLTPTELAAVVSFAIQNGLVDSIADPTLKNTSRGDA